jgi:hypothetical protein
MWAYRFIAKAPGPYSEPTDDRLPQIFGDLPGIGVVINVGVVAFDFSH